MKSRIVCTDPAMAREIARAVQLRGHALSTAASPGQAVEAQRLDPALIVITGVAPHHGGLDLCRRLRQLPGGGDTVIVACVEGSGPDGAGLMIEAGANDYVAVPVQAADLDARLALAEQRVARSAALRSAWVAQPDDRLFQLFRTIPLAASLTALDDARFIDVNDAFLALLGYTREEIVGRTEFEVRLWESTGDRSAMVQALLAGRPVRDLEWRFRAKAGDMRDTSATATLMELDGRPCVLGLYDDVTERKRAEKEVWAKTQALQASEESFRALIEESPESVIVYVDTVIAYVNPVTVRWLGHASAEDLVGHSIFDIMHPDERREIRARAPGAAARAGAAPSEERRLLGKDGRIVHGDVLAVPVAFRGRPATVLVVRDLSERKRLEAQILEADRMASVGTLASGVAHEINNPLAFMMANLHFVREEIDGLAGLLPAGRAEEMRLALVDTAQGAERIREVVADLHLFAQRGDDETSSVDVTRVLDAALGLVANEIRHRARLLKDYDAVPPVRGSEGRLGQVFINLLTNAAQAIQEGHADENEIRVSVRPGAGGQVVVEIADSGCGIPPENLGRIFNPFFTTKPVGVGTGLGLSVCLGSIRALGGDITAESTVGRGSIFKVALPAVIVDEVEPFFETPSLVEAPTQPARVLVIDDEPLLLESFRRILRGHRLRSTTDAAEALAWLVAGETFDLVLCDVMMPQMGGIELHEALAKQRPDILDRFVFMTGGAFTARAQEFLDKLRNPRLTKPIEAEVLRQLVRERMGGETPKP